MKDRAAPDVFASALGVLRAKHAHPPEIALVLGSGLGSFADTLTDKLSTPYTELSGMAASTIAGHAGKLVLGAVGKRRVVAMQGRVHLYEGQSASGVVFGVRLMLLLGARVLIVSNAAGGIAPGFAPGDLMLITDHLNLTGHNPLTGPNHDALGPRFPDMSEVYDRGLRERALACAAKTGVTLQQGVYAGMLGPSYETPAEIAMLRTLGAHAVGMSTVLETIAARHMGARCLGISCITNLAAGLSAQTLTHEDVANTARSAEARLARLLTALIEEVAL